MKLFTFLLLIFFIAAFSSCESYRQNDDEVKGTPTRADTVLPHTYARMPEAKTETHEVSSEVYRR